MTKNVTTEQMTEMIGSLADEVTKSKGLFTAYKGYFYTHGYDQDKMANNIGNKLGHDKIKIISTKNQWKPFVGGAPLKKQSYFSVTFQYIG